jgi:putative addiction module killer protein
MIPEFSQWLQNMRDRRARQIVIGRIERAAFGNVGKFRDLGQGLAEMKIDYGPGYRLYFVRRADELIILLCGGDKSSQNRDYSKTKKISLTISPTCSPMATQP